MTRTSAGRAHEVIAPDEAAIVSELIAFLEAASVRREPDLADPALQIETRGLAASRRNSTCWLLLQRNADRHTDSSSVVQA